MIWLLILSGFVIYIKTDMNCNLRFVNSEIVLKKLFHEDKSATYMEI